MFYRGLKPGVKLFRIVDGCIEVSEIKEIIGTRYYKFLKLIPIIGYYERDIVGWQQNIKCFKSYNPWPPNPFTSLLYFVGTDFDKVFRKAKKCGRLEI